MHSVTHVDAHVAAEPQSSEVIAFQSALLSLGLVHRLVKLLLLVGRPAAERALVLLSRLVCMHACLYAHSHRLQGRRRGAALRRCVCACACVCVWVGVHVEAALVFWKSYGCLASKVDACVRGMICEVFASSLIHEDHRAHRRRLAHTRIV